jgi:dTDP-4-dehydrorhamnose 3,5-epimerase
MRSVATAIADVLVFEPTLHGDSRGYFLETWRQSDFEDLAMSLDEETSATGAGYAFVQDNQSKSIQGTLRGLHYQLEFPQGKLVRVISGEVFDVAVDLRQNSPNFGQWVGVILSAENHKQLWLPPGFAHGFYVMSESAELVYKCTDYFHPEDDHSLLWNDPELNIDWPLLDTNPLLSDKDASALPLSRASLFK